MFYRAHVLAGCVMVLTVLVARAGDQPTAMQMAARVDALLAESWARAGVEPAPEASDAEFLRRASLDLTGVIPTVHDVREFLLDAESDKRARWIDMLLARPMHATHLARIWRRTLLPDGSNLAQFGGAAGFESWLQQRFRDNAPYDQTVRDLLQATGNAFDGPAVYYTALELKPEELAASTSRVFLGVQIGCAQCHNHPFDHWTKEDFWGYAAFFARLNRAGPQPAPQAGLTELTSGELKLPGTDTVVSPRFLGGDPSPDSDEATRRARLAAWLTSKENPYFARAAVNRVWAHLFGRGLVEPVDDLGSHNPPSHPELLTELAAWFAETGFDVRQLVRALANTRAYQLSSQTADAEPRPELFARMAIKTLTAEQLYDCLAEAMRRREPAVPGGVVFGGGRGFDQGRQAFVSKFAAPSQGATDFQSGIPQALTLMNGPIISSGTDLARSDLLKALAAPFFTHQERLEVLFLSTLSRPPYDEERSQFLAYFEKSASPDWGKAYGDILWALLNSAEFVLNH
jgi:hypothetical protein